jgi:spore maturation protein SpmA
MAQFSKAQKAIVNQGKRAISVTMTDKDVAILARGLMREARENGVVFAKSFDMRRELMKEMEKQAHPDM